MEIQFNLDETDKLRTSSSQLDDDTKRYHKIFTQNRDNIERWDYLTQKSIELINFSTPLESV